MKRIVIARNAGFCFGVKRAMSIADRTAAGGKAAGPIVSLGPLIHNPQAVEELEKRGLRVAATVDDIACGTVIVRSHGITRTDHEALVAKGVTIVDATCPFVSKAQEQARAMSQQGYAVIVVGDANHPEVKSILSYIEPGTPTITTLQGIREAAKIRAATKIRKAGIVAQTTQSLDNLMRFVGEAIRKFPDVRVCNTICNATTLRQRESTALAGTVEVMIVMGGYNSANTRRLADLCREINPKTIHIETADELPVDRIDRVATVGVTAGASTPQWIVDGLVARIRNVWQGRKIGVSYYR